MEKSTVMNSSYSIAHIKVYTKMCVTLLALTNFEGNSCVGLMLHT